MKCPDWYRLNGRNRNVNHREFEKITLLGNSSAGEANNQIMQRNTEENMFCLETFEQF